MRTETYWTVYRNRFEYIGCKPCALTVTRDAIYEDSDEAQAVKTCADLNSGVLPLPGDFTEFKDDYTDGYYVEKGFRRDIDFLDD